MHHMALSKVSPIFGEGHHVCSLSGHLKLSDTRTHILRECIRKGIRFYFGEDHNLESSFDVVGKLLNFMCTD